MSSLQLQLRAGTLSKSMSRMGSCEEALLLGVGDGGEVPVRAGAPTAAEEAGAERAVPSLCGYRARGRGHSVSVSEEATDTGMKNPAEIPPNSNKNWSSSQQFSPKKRFFALFQQNNVEKNSLKTAIINTGMLMFSFARLLG